MARFSNSLQHGIDRQWRRAPEYAANALLERHDQTMNTEEQCQIHAIRIQELEKRFDLHIAYQEKSVDKASSELRERLARMNELREQLDDQVATFLPRIEFDVHNRAIIARVDRIADQVSNMVGRWWVIGILGTAIGAIVGLLTNYLARSVGQAGLP
jgi:uncharacterized membrane protein